METLSVQRLIRPRSVVVIGVSTKLGSAGRIIASNLHVNGYRGAVHLVGRAQGELDGRTVLPDVDALPEGVDLAVFTMPAQAVAEAMAGCVRRKVGAAVVFASGFAEVGAEAEQAAIAESAREAGIALLGPNCLGFTNALDGLRINFAGEGKLAPLDIARDPCVAVISQSGGLLAHIRAGLEARDLPVPYAVSTGNEAGIGIAELIKFFADDPVTRSIVLYVEQVRKPSDFLVAVASAQRAGKPVLMLCPGRSDRAKSALQSHTGSLAGDHEVMRTLVRHHGVALIDTLDELLDTAEILTRFPRPPTKGPGILTLSGAFCAIAHDFCGDLDLDIPTLMPETVAALQRDLPPLVSARNPLDLTTQPVFQPDLLRIGTEALLSDENVGSVVLSISPGSPKLGLRFVEAVVAAAEGASKPLMLCLLGDRAPVAPEISALARERRLILSNSTDRTLCAVAQVTIYGRSLRRTGRVRGAARLPEIPPLPAGALAEWQGKRILAAIGIPVPAGNLVRTVDEAVALAERVGYPVAMKAQAATLQHKTDAGAVKLGLATEAEIRRAWSDLHEKLYEFAPSLQLDGLLVERMAPKGLELVVGARRDPKWGPVVLVGLGGIFVEALADVRLLPPDLDEAEVVEELSLLRGASLLGGFRGLPPVDVNAVARAAVAIGALMRQRPEISEIDINPLFAHPQGQGVTAVDALVIAGSRE